MTKITTLLYELRELLEASHSITEHMTIRGLEDTELYRLIEVACEKQIDKKFDQILNK